MSSTITLNYDAVIAETAAETVPYYDEKRRIWLEYISKPGSIQIRLINGSVIWLDRDLVTMHPDDGVLGPNFTIRKDYWERIKKAKRERVKKSEWFQD